MNEAPLIDRPWAANPQTMACVRARKEYTGHELLGAHVDRDTWLTPRYVLDQLGEFDLDPCAAAACPDWVCKWSFTKADNGLVHPWCGRVFCNPPFSETQRWIEKCAAHGNGVSLVPASVESRVWRKFVWPKASAVLLLHGRMRFCNPDGSTTTGRPLRSIAIIAWTPADAEVLSRSALAGILLTEWRQR